MDAPRSQAWLFRTAEIGFFALFLAVGLLVYKDYGLSWDEPAQRGNIGVPSYRLARFFQPELLLASKDNLYGPFFEIVLVFVEDLCHWRDTHDIYLGRHLLNFLVFYLAVVVFYRLLRRRVDRWSSLAGAVFLVFSPRIFADSFYNSKDLVFLSFYIFALDTLDRFLRQPGARRAIQHALVCGWLIDIRILGVILPAITVVLFLLASLDRKQSAGRHLKPLGLFLILQVAFIILFWPMLWCNPLLFVSAFRQMSQYPWGGDVLYLGTRIKATELPWHYIPVWVGVTTPLCYLVLAGSAIPALLVWSWRRPLEHLREHPLDAAMLMAGLGPWAAIVVLHSVVYDGWRHLFFIYPPLLYFAVLAFAALLRAVAAWQGVVRLVPGLAVAALAACLAHTGWVMVQEHPYQNVYFNRLAGPNLAVIRHRFELDYWGLSCRKGLEYLVQHDPAGVIPVYACSSPGELNAQLLPAEQRQRLSFTENPQQARYLISHYREGPNDYPPQQDVFAIEVDGGRILVVQRLPDGPNRGTNIRQDRN